MPTAAERTRRIAYGTKEFFIGGKHFCCCIPNRAGVIIGSCLTFLVSGALAIVIWFEVSTEHDMTFTSADRSEFILGGVLETMLFLASTLGFVGGIVRKQLFIMIYGYFLYVHFLINLGVGSFIMWKINHTTSVDISVACQKAITNPDGQKQCKGLLNVTRGVLIGAIVLVLLIELYGILIVTRYMRQLKREKRHSRASSQGFLLQRKGYASLEGEDLDYSPHPRDGPANSTLSATYFPSMPAMAAEHKDLYRDPEQ